MSEFKDIITIPHGFIDFSKLIHESKNIIWAKNIGKHIPFVYDSISGEFTIVDVNKNILKLKFEDCEFEIPNNTLRKGLFHKKINANAIKYKRPDLIKHIKNHEDINISYGSTKKIEWVCDKCNHIFIDAINNVIARGAICPHCNKLYSFGENVFVNILNQKNIKYKHRKKFSWSNNKEYDFYLPDYNTIIEVHGLQHYKQVEGNKACKWKSLEEQQENDNYKYMLAINNGVEKYIIIDCRYSKIDWIKNSILNSELLNKIIDTTSLEWADIFNFNKNDIYNEVCKQWNNKKTIKEISKNLNIDRHYVSELLLLSTENNDTNYLSECKTRQYSNRNNSKPIYCKTKNLYFRSSMLCEQLSEDVLGCKIISKNLSRQIKKQHPTKGLIFQYISKEEFNKLKQESPERCFGDSFIL